MIFESQYQILTDTWQAFERNLCRLLFYEGFTNVRLVGQTGDHGADVTATRITSQEKKRWLFQAKHWKKPVGETVVQETIDAAYEYSASVPVIVAASGFEAPVKAHQKVLLTSGIPLQLWDSEKLVERAKRLPDVHINKRDCCRNICPKR